MKETKAEKGITLVALIITIVILLILTAVAISAIQNTKIVEYANSAGKQYNTKANEEQTFLGVYNSYIENYNISTGTFTVRNQSTGEVHMYKFVQGETWNDYIYKNPSFTISSGGWVYYLSYYLERNGIAIKKTDLISNGGVYGIDPDDTSSPWFPLN